MSTDDRSRLRRRRRSRVAALRQRAQNLAGGSMRHWESEALPAAERERFWERVIEFETAPSTTNFDQLIEAGVDLPEPDALSDQQLHTTLWTAITALADSGVFIEQTNHLSDRELYVRLWDDVLREPVPLLNGDAGVWHVDLLGGCSEEDIQLFLRYYADDKWRRDWAEEFPDYPMPPHEDPPYDRDRRMPKPYDTQPPR